MISSNNLKKVMFLLLFLYNSALYLLETSSIFLYAFVAVGTIYIFFSGKVKLGKFIIFLCVFFIYTVAASFWSLSHNVLSDVIRIVLKNVVFCIITYNIIEEKKDVEKILLSLCWSGIVMSVYSIHYYGIPKIVDAIANGIRLGAEINQINGYGLYSAISFILCIYFGLNKRKKWYYLLSIVPGLISVSSGSRKALLIMILALMFFVLLKAKKKKFVLAIPAVMLVYFSIDYLLSLPYFYQISLRLKTFFAILDSSGSADASTIIRKQLIMLGFKFFSHNPIFGSGTDSYRYLASSYFTWGETASHNNYIEILVNYGLLGFTIYYGSIIYAISKIFRLFMQSEEYSEVILFVITIGLILMDMSMVSYLNGLTYIILAMTFGFIRIVNNFNKSKLRAIRTYK